MACPEPGRNHLSPYPPELFAPVYSPQMTLRQMIEYADRSLQCRGAESGIWQMKVRFHSAGMPDTSYNREILASKGLREGAGIVVIGGYIFERWALEEMNRLRRSPY